MFMKLLTELKSAKNACGNYFRTELYFYTQSPHGGRVERLLQLWRQI
jgi:hypothetical protein